MITIHPDVSSGLTREAQRSADGLETGGILLGHDRGERIHVTVAGPPGPNAVRGSTRFDRDLEVARTLADEAYEHDGSVWIGEWHTHPNGSAEPSGLDLTTYMSHLANPDLGFERVLAIIAIPCAEHGWVEVSVAPWVITPGLAVLCELEVEEADDA